MLKLFNVPFFAFFDPKNKSKRAQIIMSVIAFAMLVVSGICLGVMSMYFSAGSYYYKLDIFEYCLKQPLLVLLNCLPFIVISLLIWFITNRAWIGFLCSGAFCLVYSFAEFWKLSSRDDPIYAGDLSLMGEAMQMAGDYIEFTWQMGLAVALVVIGTVFLFLFIRGKMPHFSLRIALPVVTLVLCVFLYNGVYASQEIYDSFATWPQINPWFETNKYISRGGVYPFIYSIQSATPQAPDGYNRNDAKELLASYENDEIPENKQANIVIVMLEAFSDLSKYTDMITGEDPYSDYHKLQAESYTGELVTNIFAAGTINSERCVLTGFTELTNFRRECWSYARYFNDMGYTVDGGHGGYEMFYNRQNINRNLGFQDYRFFENHYSALSSGIPGDDIFLADVANVALSQIESGEKVFSFSVTYQNHGPYSTTELIREGEYVPKGQLSDYDYYVANNYLGGVADTGENMIKMVDAFRETDEPVIVVFFGDHKPWLGDGNSTYTALGIDFSSNSDKAVYNYYNTEYLIWANESAKKLYSNDFCGEGPAISPCYLMNVLFEHCGWDGPAFLKLSNEVMEKMPVVSSNDNYLVDGELISEKDMTEEYSELLMKLRFAQFYLAQDSKGKMPE